ncbi:MAG: response regulator [Treponema sp.]|nr:response regulator [Treponema sp.]
MITIIIADDEKIIRAGIAKILRDSIKIPIEILEAKNGKEALELCKKEQPDVLITDIRMPIMDGVELMQNIAELENKPSMIVSSGYDDFVFAKAAIQSGATSYILKPLDKKELVEAVEKAIAAHRKTEQKKNEETLKNIVDEGRLDSSTEISGVKFENGFYCVVVIGNHCKSILSQVLNSVDYWTLESKNGFECVVIPREALYLIETDLSLNQYIVGISNSSNNVSSLRISKKQAVEAVLQSYFVKESFEKMNGCYYFPENAMESNWSEIDTAYEKIVSKLAISEVKEISSGLKKLFAFENENKEYNAALLFYIYNKLNANLFTRFPGWTDNDLYLHLKGIMIENIWQYKNLKEWNNCVSDYIIYLSELLKKETSEYPFIDEALEYVKENFTKNINMAMVANQVSINYTWFSEKFKEHTGMVFNEYLRKLRIEEACRLLEKDCYKVYEVAQKSGFGDVKYFMKTFKEETGFSPTEWKKTHVLK